MPKRIDCDIILNDLLIAASRPAIVLATACSSLAASKSKLSRFRMLAAIPMPWITSAFLRLLRKEMLAVFVS